jgi:eukaryotic-like serine/threonine-protein kinase
VTPIRGEATAERTYRNFHQLPDGSGIVHRCENIIFGREFVQKTIRRSAGAVAFQEPRLLKEFDHPHVTPVLEAQFDPDYPGFITLVMPFYEGGSVARALANNHRFSIHEAISIVRDGLDALEYVHARHRCAHRDVKPSNVLMNAGRTEGYLSDFGNAARMGADGKAHAVLSTYEYMAPECAVSRRHGPEADVYGFGMTLFEMVNGRLPWESFDRPSIETRILSGSRALPERHYASAAFAPSVPPSLIRVVRQAIHPNPNKRFVSAAEMVSALNRVIAIDWRHIEGAELEGRWEGGWPPQMQPLRRDTYRIVSEVITRGAQQGRRSLVAQYRRPDRSEWRRFGVPDRVVDQADAHAVRRFFNDVADNAAHRSPAR